MTGGASTRVVAFDVDGTVTARDCVVPFSRAVAGTWSLGTGLLAQPTALVGALARRDRDAVKAAGAAAAFRGRTPEELDTVAEGFAAQVVTDGLRAEVADRLRHHVDAGDVVVFVSASFEVYLRPLAALLGVDDVIGTRLEVGTDGRLTGALDGPNCRGPEKVVRLHAWLDALHGGRAAVHLTAFGDSTGDRELLADADVAHWVGRGPMPRPAG